jgi:hypothetical protein
VEIAAKQAARHNLNIDYRGLTNELKEAETLKRGFFSYIVDTQEII